MTDHHDDQTAEPSPAVEPYRLRTPSQAARELAEHLPGGRADADGLVRDYLAEATARHGLPEDGWWLDADDLAAIRARHDGEHRADRLAVEHADQDTTTYGLPDQDDRANGDREHVLTEGPGTPVGGMWFTPDEQAPGGVRPLTEAELRAITDRIRATQAEALAQDLAPPPAGHSRYHSSDEQADVDEGGWSR